MHNFINARVTHAGGQSDGPGASTGPGGRRRDGGSWSLRLFESEAHPADGVQELGGKRLVDLLPEAGKMVFCFEAADLVVLAQSVIDEFERLCSEHRLTLQVAFPKTPLPCIVDPDKMRQVLRNVLANPVEYSPEERDIEVALRGRDGLMEVTVCDRGPAIPEEEIEAIFEDFVQAVVDMLQTRARERGLMLSVDIDPAVTRVRRILSG